MLQSDADVILYIGSHLRMTGVRLKSRRFAISGVYRGSTAPLPGRGKPSAAIGDHDARSSAMASDRGRARLAPPSRCPRRVTAGRHSHSSPLRRPSDSLIGSDRGTIPSHQLRGVIDGRQLVVDRRRLRGRFNLNAPSSAGTKVTLIPDQAGT
jgi:hypothetical protein